LNAGEAFRRAMEADPETGKRVRVQLQAFAIALQAVLNKPEHKAALKKLKRVQRRLWQKLAAMIRASNQRAGDKLAGRHFRRPECLEGWMHLARVAEVPIETIRTGNLTLREIYEHALAWADRQIIRAKLAAEANAEPGAAGPPAPPPLEDKERRAVLALLRVYTNGVADERIRQAARIAADDTLTANEKLTRIDELIPVPPTASAEQLGALLGVSKTAVLKTEWWDKNRRGMADEAVELRRSRLKDHGRRSDLLRSDEDAADR
jgi:hypothetical protein